VVAIAIVLVLLMVATCGRQKRGATRRVETGMTWMPPTSGRYAQNRTESSPTPRLSRPTRESLAAPRRHASHTPTNRSQGSEELGLLRGARALALVLRQACRLSSSPPSSRGKGFPAETMLVHGVWRRWTPRRRVTRGRDRPPSGHAIAWCRTRARVSPLGRPEGRSRCSRTGFPPRRAQRARA
jgi:hypothetical protein